MEGDIHTVLDFATLVSIFWVIYMIKFKLKSSYIAELDIMPIYYLVVPCAILAVMAMAAIQSHIMRLSTEYFRTFCVYLESVAVLPQLRMIHNAKIIEPFAAHYVFALGVARFLSCAHWIIKVYDTAGKYLFLFGGEYLWVPMVLLSEIVRLLLLLHQERDHAWSASSPHASACLLDYQYHH